MPQVLVFFRENLPDAEFAAVEELRVIEQFSKVSCNNQTVFLLLKDGGKLWDGGTLGRIVRTA